MSAVMNAIGVAFAYAVLALFAQNAIFTREERETLRELYEGLWQISEREQTYLLYRHTLRGAMSRK